MIAFMVDRIRLRRGARCEVTHLDYPGIVLSQSIEHVCTAERAPQAFSIDPGTRLFAHIFMTTYLLALGFAIVLLGAHMVGLDGLYVSVPVYDIFMHILGGAGVALLLVGIAHSWRPDLSHRGRFIIAGVVVVGLLWEVFEAAFGLTGYPVGSRLYWIDTVKDLIDDAIGAAMIVFVAGKR